MQHCVVVVPCCAVAFGHCSHCCIAVVALLPRHKRIAVGVALEACDVEFTIGNRFACGVEFKFVIVRRGVEQRLAVVVGRSDTDVAVDADCDRATIYYINTTRPRRATAGIVNHAIRTCCEARGVEGVGTNVILTKIFFGNLHQTVFAVHQSCGREGADVAIFVFQRLDVERTRHVGVVRRAVAKHWPEANDIFCIVIEARTARVLTDSDFRCYVVLQIAVVVEHRRIFVVVACLRLEHRMFGVACRIRSRLTAIDVKWVGLIDHEHVPSDFLLATIAADEGVHELIGASARNASLYRPFKRICSIRIAVVVGVKFHCADVVAVVSHCGQHRCPDVRYFKVWTATIIIVCSVTIFVHSGHFIHNDFSHARHAFVAVVYAAVWHVALQIAGFTIGFGVFYCPRRIVDEHWYLQRRTAL